MSTNYQLWMTGNGSSSKLQFPVHPERIDVYRGTNNETVRITGVGEVIIKQKPAADRVKWSSFFPNATFPGVQVSNPKSPGQYVQQINEWKDSDKPVKLVSTACGICDHYSIEQFDYYETGGDVGTIQYTIELKLYREVTARQVKVSIEEQKATVPRQEEPRVDDTVQPKTYTVVAGDCLWNIAKRFYGDGSRYTEIYNANPGVFNGRSPNLIYVGDVLTIP